ncbi:SDR family NAD(P)-dependent oxidoreductase [Bacillus licheniformis]|nr:SDR family NAD(P)-dependent oxidoreductase [Bacillus licheniformis]
MQSLQTNRSDYRRGRGIGRATAIALAKKAYISALSAVQLRILKSGRGIEGVRCKVSVAAADVKDLTAVERAVQSVKEELGQIDILINNAGIGGFAGFLEQSPEEWENIIQVNLMGFTM